MRPMLSLPQKEKVVQCLGIIPKEVTAYNLVCHVAFVTSISNHHHEGKNGEALVEK